MGIVEISGHGDDGASHGLAQEQFRALTKVTEQKSRNLRNGVGAVGPDEDCLLVFALSQLVGQARNRSLHFLGLVGQSDEAFGREDGVLGIDDPPCYGLAREVLEPIVGKRHHRGVQVAAMGCRYDDHLVVADGGNHRIRGSKINADYRHGCAREVG